VREKKMTEVRAPSALRVASTFDVSERRLERAVDKGGLSE